jgi:chromosome segregation ATPase
MDVKKIYILLVLVIFLTIIVYFYTNSRNKGDKEKFNNNLPKTPKAVSKDFPKIELNLIKVPKIDLKQNELQEYRKCVDKYKLIDANKYNKLVDDYNNLQNSYNSIRNYSIDLQNQYSSMYLQNNDYLNRLNTLQSEMNRLNQQINTVTSDLENCNSSKDFLQRQYDSLNQRYSSLEGVYNNLIGENGVYNQLRDTYLAFVERCNNELYQKDEQIRDLSNKLQKCFEDYNNYIRQYC